MTADEERQQDALSAESTDKDERLERDESTSSAGDKPIGDSIAQGDSDDGVAGEDDSSATGAGGVDGENVSEEDEAQWEPLTPELVEDEAIRGDFMLRWAAVLLVLLLACTEIAESETLVHIKSGQYMAANNWLPPGNDPFSYTAADRRWINLSWLFDLVVAGMYSATGMIGLWVMKIVLASTTFALVVHISRANVSTWWGSMCAAIAAIACYPQFTVRPELVTLFAIGLALFLLFDRQTDSLRIWLLVPVFFVWANVDNRMFLGLLLLLLYAIGDAIGNWLGRPCLENFRRKQLWGVVVCCFLAALLNPFGWHSLAAGLTLYGTEYPALREYYASVRSVGELYYFPVASSVFWDNLNVHVIAGLALIALTPITFVLNRANVDFGHIFVYMGFVALAAAGSHELAAAGIVCSVLATLNAQGWYQDNVRQTYSVDTLELMLSRSGRAVTVLAVFALAYVASSGRLSGENGTRVGLGIDARLQSNIDGLSDDVADSFDDRPFNFVLRQGDVLIFVGQRVFVDSRVALYSGNGDDDLLGAHDLARHALRRRRPGRPKSGLPEVWRGTFDRFDVTHVLPRLDGVNPDYESYLDLVRAGDEWQLTRLGAVAAVFYRRNAGNAELDDYLSTRRTNFVADAFRSETEEVPLRTDWARPHSVYAKYLSLPTTNRPNDLLMAQHYQMHLQAASQQQLGLVPGVAAAIAHLAIRRLTAVLADDQNNAVAYNILGNVYQYLLRIEQQVAGGSVVDSIRRRRYYQMLNAYHQALIVEPTFRLTRTQLIDTYLSNNKFDLALQILSDYEDLRVPESIKTPPEKLLTQIAPDLKQKLSQEIEAVKARVRDAAAQGANDLALAGLASEGGCVLYALELLEEDPALLERNPRAQLLCAFMLLESGRAEEAFDLLGQLEGIAHRYRGLEWRWPQAVANLANGKYDAALTLFASRREHVEVIQLLGLLEALPLVHSPADFPVEQAALAADALYDFPQEAAVLELNVALCDLEVGRNEEAGRVLRGILESTPDTSLRHLVRFYLFQINGEMIDPEPPSDWIPITPDIFVPDVEPGAATSASS